MPSSTMTAPPSTDGGVTNVNRFFKVLRTVDFKEPVDISNTTIILIVEPASLMTALDTPPGVLQGEYQVPSSKMPAPLSV